MRISDLSSDVCSSDLPSLCRQLAFDSLVRLLNLHGDILLNSLYNFRCGVVGQISRFQCSKQFDVHPVLLLVGDGRHPAWAPAPAVRDREAARSEEHTSELQSLMRISYAVLCLKKK